jgi:hypothetical protein
LVSNPLVGHLSDWVVDNGGRVVIGEPWQDEKTFMPVHERPLGYVFQEASLFPHLSVRANLEYGYKRIPAAERRVQPEQVVEWLGLGHILERGDPAGLSTPLTQLSATSLARPARRCSKNSHRWKRWPRCPLTTWSNGSMSKANAASLTRRTMPAACSASPKTHTNCHRTGWQLSTPR